MRTLASLFRGLVYTMLVAVVFTLYVKVPIPAHAEIELTTGSVITIVMRPRVNPEQKKCLVQNIYFEGRGESYFGQAMIAHVTLNRVRANQSYWGGKTICGVVRHPNMFSWYSELDDHEMYDEVARQVAEFIADYVLDGRFTPPTELVDADHYLNPETAERKNLCWFRTKLLELGSVERHDYYRSPRNILESSLASIQDAPACRKRKQIAKR